MDRDEVVEKVKEAMDEKEDKRIDLFTTVILFIVVIILFFMIGRWTDLTDKIVSEYIVKTKNPSITNLFWVAIGASALLIGFIWITGINFKFIENYIK